jgi:polar amino acid transport system permease protein
MAVTTAPATTRKKMSPRKRARIIRIIQYAVLVLAVLAVILLSDGQQIMRTFFRPDMVQLTVGLPLLNALKNTILYTIGAFIFGLVLGTVLALMKLSQVGPYRWIATAYTEFFRGVPAIIVLLVFSLLPLALPGLKIPLDPYGTVWLALGLVSGAYMSETIRAGIEAVPEGQMEAARSLGMPSGMAMSRIILPQAFRIVTPPLTNELVLLTKDSSLVYVLGLMGDEFELTKYGRDLANTYANVTPLVIAGLTYLVITLPLTFLVRRMEARQKRSK